MKYKINLLPEKKLGLINKSFYFALHYLRYILVITLLLTIIVFFYKISADQEIIDTSEAVMQKQEILKISKPLIDESRNLNLKSAEIQSIFQKQHNLSDLLEYLLSRFPESFVLTKFNTDNMLVNFSGKTTKLDILQIFYHRLQKEKRFKDVQLNNIEKKLGEVNFTFVLKDFIPEK